MLSTSESRMAVEREVMRAVAEANGPYRPADLIKNLKQDGFGENSIRAAMWNLIDRQQVRVTSDLKLTMR